MNLSQSSGGYNTPKSFRKKKMNYLGYKPVGKLSNKSKVIDYKKLWEDLSKEELLEKINYFRIKQDTLLQEISTQNIKTYHNLTEQIQQLLQLLEKKNKKQKLKELFYDLVKEEKELKESNFNIEAYVASLSTEDPKVKKFIVSRLTAFDSIENKLNQLIPILKQAKRETLAYYKKNPSFEILYGTDLAIDYLNDLLKLFEK